MEQQNQTQIQQKALPSFTGLLFQDTGERLEYRVYPGGRETINYWTMDDLTGGCGTDYPVEFYIHSTGSILATAWRKGEIEKFRSAAALPATLNEAGWNEPTN